FRRVLFRSHTHKHTHTYTYTYTYTYTHTHICMPAEHSPVAGAELIPKRSFHSGCTLLPRGSPFSLLLPLSSLPSAEQCVCVCVSVVLVHTNIMFCSIISFLCFLLMFVIHVLLCIVVKYNLFLRERTFDRGMRPMMPYC